MFKDDKLIAWQSVVVLLFGRLDILGNHCGNVNNRRNMSIDL